MKKLFAPLFIAFIAMNTLVSCNQDEDLLDVQTNETAALAKDAFTQKLTDAFMEIVSNENGDYDEGGYILYNAETDEMVACTEFAYCVGYALAGEEVPVVDMSSASKPICKAPSGKGWVFAGTSKTNPFAATTFVTSLSKKIPKNSNFEIHAEYDQQNKVYRVWYRIVK